VIDYCKRCDKRDTCTKLCATAAEYADQDYVPKDFDLTIKGMDEFSDKDKLIPEYGDIKKDILRYLSKKQVEVVKFHYNEGMSTYEISEKLNITPQAVWIRLQTALKVLRENYKFN